MICGNFDHFDPLLSYLNYKLVSNLLDCKTTSGVYKAVYFSTHSIITNTVVCSTVKKTIILGEYFQITSFWASIDL